ncbi:MAG: exodeoxyribonuclease small subunit [Bacteroidetes bacterium]|jgi:exodeoxyribonuclease VII small subunit|nr:exodeoxyribonuclease small subunit [Bacteroidota bacterium]
MAQKKKDPGEATFDESLRRLEEIVAQMEQGEIPLEESLKLYEEGIALSKVCAQKLQQAELTIKRLGKDLEGNLKLFEEDSE